MEITSKVKTFSDKRINEQLKVDKKYLNTLKIPQEYLAYLGLNNGKFRVDYIKPRFYRSDYSFVDGEIKTGRFPDWNNLPKPEDREIVWEFHVKFFNLNELKIMTLQEIKTAINHIEIISIDQLSEPLKVIGRQFNCKDVTSLQEIKILLDISEDILNSNKKQFFYVTEIINLTTDSYDVFVSDFSLEHDWLKNKRGYASEIKNLPELPFFEMSEEDRKSWLDGSYSKSLAIKADGRQYILFNPQTKCTVQNVIFPTKASLKDLKTYQYLNQPFILKEEASCDCKVASINQSNQNTDKLQNCYKFWLQKQIEKNQLSEVMSFKDWKNFYDSERVKENYLEFIKKCVDEGWNENIMSFADWLIYLFE